MRGNPHGDLGKAERRVASPFYSLFTEISVDSTGDLLGNFGSRHKLAYLVHRTYIAIESNRLQLQSRVPQKNQYTSRFVRVILAQGPC